LAVWQVHRKVAHRNQDRLTLDPVGAVSDGTAHLRLQAELALDVRRWSSHGDHELGVSVELLTCSPGTPDIVGGSGSTVLYPEQWVGAPEVTADEPATAVLGLDQAIVGELVQGCASGESGHAVLGHQGVLTGEPITWTEVTGLDGVGQIVGDVISLAQLVPPVVPDLVGQA